MTEFFALFPALTDDANAQLLSLEQVVLVQRIFGPHRTTGGAVAAIGAAGAIRTTSTSVGQFIGCDEATRLLPEVVEGVEAGVGHGIAEVFLDPQQLVVLGDTVGTGQRTGLDLAGIEADGDVGDGAVFGFTGAM